MPVGPDQAVMIPAVALRTPVARNHALEYAQKVLDLANDLPDPEAKPDIIVASNLDNVDKAVNMERQFRGQ